MELLERRWDDRSLDGYLANDHAVLAAARSLLEVWKTGRNGLRLMNFGLAVVVRVLEPLPLFDGKVLSLFPSSKRDND
jgi:hypothetical protein